MKKLNNFKNLSKAITDFNRKAPVVIKRITSDNILTTNCDVKLFNFNKCNILSKRQVYLDMGVGTI